VIDLRSDTATRPTAGMRAAIAGAEVGDEQRREDPTVNELQERAAALLGHEAALFLPTATLANQIALKLHSRPGDVLVAERYAHVVIYEYGGAAAHAGLMVETIEGRHGRFGVDELEAVTVPSTKSADQRPAVLAVENTHNAATTIQIALMLSPRCSAMTPRHMAPITAITAQTSLPASAFIAYLRWVFRTGRHGPPILQRDHHDRADSIPAIGS